VAVVLARSGWSIVTPLRNRPPDLDAHALEASSSSFAASTHSGGQMNRRRRLTHAALDGGLVEFVRDLKQQGGGDVGVHASISVAQALLAAGVVDELRLVIAPRIAGRGRRLLDGLPSIQLESIEARSHRLAICSSTIALFLKSNV